MTTWRIKDRLFTPTLPAVMGIINATPDSFHAPSRAGVDEAVRLADRMITEGATILDIGGQSSRPGSGLGTAEEEMGRVLPVIDAIHRRFPDAVLSVDTWRAEVARAAVEHGAGLVNDISAGSLDPAMLAMVAGLHVPYIAMHMQGTPDRMQHDPRYSDVSAEVTRFLSARLAAAHHAGIADVILDPGFGFGKDVDHNYALLRALPRIAALGTPLLVGLSRKRMINAVLGSQPADALNGTTVLHTIALLNGATILRVHDVKEAVECVALVRRYSS